MVNYTVFIDDNYHFGESGGYRVGDFDTYEEAVTAASKVVEDYIRSAYREGMSAEELLSSYRTFGDDPYIVPDDGTPPFSAWAYAERLCRELCG